MEKYLLLYLIILLVGLFISFIIFSIDYSMFRKRIEKILNLDIETNNHIREATNLYSEINKDIKDVCISNNILIKKLLLVTKENNYLRQTIISNKENNEK